MKPLTWYKAIICTTIIIAATAAFACSSSPVSTPPSRSTPPSSIHPPPSFSADILSMWPDNAMVNKMMFYVTVIDVNRQDKISTGNTKAMVALVWLQTNAILDQKIVTWQTNSPVLQGINFQIFSPQPEYGPLAAEYNNLKKSKDAAYTAAKAKAQKDFLEGKPYIEVNPFFYEVTDQESAKIARKYVKLLVEPYINR